MHPYSDPDLDPISERLRAEEAQLRRRIVWLTLIPVAVAVLLIWFTSSQVADAKRDLGVLADSLARVDRQLIISVEELAAKRAEIDSLDALKTAYYTELEKMNKAAAEATRDEAIEQFQKDRAVPRVYLHIIREEQRAQARAFQTVLEGAGLIVPGIEKLSRGPRVSELRYFREDDRDIAQRIQTRARRSGTPLRLVDLSAKYGSSSSIRPGHLEIWFGPEFGR